MSRPLGRVAVAVAALAVAGLSAAAPTASAAPASAAAAAPQRAATVGVDQPAVDLSTLNMVPTAMGGVLTPDPARTQTSSIASSVWSIRQAGTKIFVGGMFLDVKADAASSAVRQPFLAAFDLTTGAWDSSCRPALDNAVYALAVSPTGSLLVGGEFTTVNGVARPGLVALDPATCAVDPTFPDTVERPYSNQRAAVRDLVVADGKLYLAGNFSRVSGPNSTHTGVFKVARVDATTGKLDTTFKPEVTGSGVWGIAVDVPRNRVHLGGWFSGVAAASGTSNYAVVDGTTGALVTGLTARPRNNTARMEVYDVELGTADRVYVGGSEHILQMLDAATGDQLAFSHTGYNGCEATRFTWCNYIGAGGDFQVAERIGKYVFGGCHCNDDYVGTSPTHYSSVTRTFTKHKHLMAYEAGTETLVDSFRPDVDGAVEGAWAVGSDTNGCLYVGGDYTKGGAAAGRSMWVSGIAKLCPKAAPKPAGDTTAPTAPKNVEAVDLGGGVLQVQWTDSTDAVGVDHYRVAVTGGASVDAAAGPAKVTGVPAGSATVTVTALDAAGNISAGAAVSIATGRTGGDTASPTAPTGLAVSAAAGGAALTWTPSTDAVGVKSYLVYRDGTYVGWSATPAWTDSAAPAGTELTYTVRATDAAGNRSVKSAAATVTLK
ncbi:delta-60 repeat domain-containing protein [Kineosporia sp. A_224]|uniref:delta-60 repeat domain-containing protein n=1 Tax=Kineosporia sp. A_224 TaxID=1962180 RepID=UPI000B4C16A7|nr:delta-60 repeat domain-containing protein [Kineosporia sp. A_224]